jgi:hypothetical protein
MDVLQSESKTPQQESNAEGPLHHPAVAMDVDILPMQSKCDSDQPAAMTSDVNVVSVPGAQARDTTRDKKRQRNREIEGLLTEDHQGVATLGIDVRACFFLKLLFCISLHMFLFWLWTSSRTASVRIAE